MIRSDLDMRAAIRAIAAAVLIAAGAACSDHNGVPGHLADLRSACDGTKYADAAPYSGRAPHPIALFLAPHGNDFSDAKLADYNYTDPTEEIRPYQPTDSHRVQLIACGAIIHETKAGPDCTYSDSDNKRRFSVPHRSARYRVTVYELRTHHMVGTATVSTSPGIDFQCPMLLKRSAAPDNFLDQVDINDWIVHLEKYVSRSSS